MYKTVGRIAVAIVAMAVPLAYVTHAQAQTSADDPVVAIVNDTKIHLSDVEEARQFLPQEVQAYPFQVLYDHLVTNLIDSQLLAAEARKENLHEEEDFKKRIAGIEQQILRQKLLEKRVTGQVTEEKLRARYSEFVKTQNSSEEVHARHILVETEAKALDVIARLDKGEKFAELAKSVSTGPSGKAGGDLGFFTRERMVPAFSEAAFALARGKMTKKPVQTQFGWHVIMVEEKRQAAPPTFSQAEKELRENLTREVAEEVVKTLRSTASIKRFGPDGKPMPAR
ncbi:MAG: peptidylprolyl isomerase [Proteobacteria bacterium]|nr:peptidylprolyl isomerase [Pseudomonadota bacterium]